MNDYSELKRLAAATEDCEDEQAWAAFIAAANPAAVLELITEIGRWKAIAANQKDQTNVALEIANERREERDQLKAEVEALRKYLSDIYDSIEREYWSEYAGLDQTRSILDMAMRRDASYD